MGDGKLSRITMMMMNDLLAVAKFADEVVVVDDAHRDDLAFDAHPAAVSVEACWRNWHV